MSNSGNKCINIVYNIILVHNKFALYIIVPININTVCQFYKVYVCIEEDTIISYIVVQYNIIMCICFSSNTISSYTCHSDDTFFFRLLFDNLVVYICV